MIDSWPRAARESQQARHRPQRTQPRHATL